MRCERRSLTACAVSPDGGTIRLGFREADGLERDIELSVDEAGAIAMTLPGLIEKAMRLRHHDASLRYAYPLGSWSLERSSDPATVMMSLRTPDGFGVCFSMRWDQGDALGATLSQSQPWAAWPAFN